MATKKYVIEICDSDPFVSDTGDTLYITTNAMHMFFGSELEEMEEITETPEEAYKRGLDDGIKEGTRASQELLCIELHAEEIVKLYKKLLEVRK